jgi:hypothetical protein
MRVSQTFNLGCHTLVHLSRLELREQLVHGQGVILLRLIKCKSLTAPLSDLSGVNPATNDRMILYYCLMTKVDWFRR